MDFPRVKRREPSAEADSGVYADLQELIRLKYKAQGFSFFPRQPVHSILAGRHASRLRGRGLNFEELRGYLPGDDIRNIDWKVTARTQKPHVRVYTEEKDRPALLLVDQRSSMFFGSQRSMKSVAAAETAALAAWRILDSGDRVGAIIFDEQNIEEIRPHRSDSRVMQILESVVRFNKQLPADQTKSSDKTESSNQFNIVLESAKRLAKHDYLVILISDCFGADQQSGRIITSMCQHNDMIVGFIYDPLESEMPNVGRTVVSDGDLQLELDTGNADLRKKFKEQFDDRLERAKHFSRTREIPLLPIHTGEEVATQIRKLLGQPGR